MRLRSGSTRLGTAVLALLDALDARRKKRRHAAAHRPRPCAAAGGLHRPPSGSGARGWSKLTHCRTKSEPYGNASLPHADKKPVRTNARCV